MARVSRADVVLAHPVSRGAAALVVAALGGVGLYVLFTWLDEELQLPFVSWPTLVVGAMVVVLATSWTFRNFGPRNVGAAMSRTVLADRAVAAMQRLPANYFRQSMGDPWPVAVVGPTGAFVVWPQPLPEGLRVRDGVLTVKGKPVDPFTDVRRLTDELARRLEPGAAALPTTGLVVVDPTVVVPPSLHAGRGRIRVVTVDEVVNILTFGTAADEQTVRRGAEAVAGWRHI